MEKKKGRPSTSEIKKSFIVSAYAQGMPINEICDVFSISSSTLYNIINEYKQNNEVSICRQRLM